LRSSHRPSPAATRPEQSHVKQNGTWGGRGGFGELIKLSRGHRGRIALGLILTLLALGLSLVQPLLVKHVIEVAGTGAIIWKSVVLLILLFVSQALVEAVVRYTLTRTGEGIVLGVRLNLIGHLLRLHMRAYEQHRIGDLISRTTSDGLALRRLLAEGVADALTGALGVVATLILMLSLDLFLFVIVTALVAGGSLCLLTVLRGIRTVALRAQHVTGEMTSDLERALSAIRTIRASQAERRESERLAGHARSIYAESLRMAKLDAVVGPASVLVINGSFLVVLLVGGIRVSDATTSVGELVAFLLYLTYLAGPIGAAFQAIGTIQQGRASLHRIDEILHLPSEQNEHPEDSVPVDGDGTSTTTGHIKDKLTPPALEFRDVWFGYDAERPVLRGVCFSVPPRRRTALVGASGAGKSTVLALVERYYDPDRGQVLCFGKDARTVALEDYRRRIGVVEQHVPVLHGTLRENLTYSRPEVSEEELFRVIRSTSLAPLVARLPNGLDSDVGEHGAMLSGGERQRVVLARLLIRRPDLLLLDEPTAHLDPLTEAALYHALDEISDECSLLVIAHKFTTVRTADQVVVLDAGQVVATGTHEELLEQSAYYRMLAGGMAEPPHSRPAPYPA
jgi:ABC-type multidrug transport system fused ATPase/permease subunit